MSAKISKKSKVISSKEEMNSESDLDLDDINDGSDVRDSDSEHTPLPSTNTSWADAINKVLSVKSKPKNKSFVLSKAKKDRDLKRESDQQIDEGLEIVTSDGTLLKSSDKNKRLKPNEKIEIKSKNKLKLTKKEWEVMSKLKPKTEDRDRERMLCAIATKGVVQLFNAVREQQKTIETKVNEMSSETKREKMLTQFNKKQFLDKLKPKDNSKQDKTKNLDKKQTEEQKWKVLSDDFMIGAKMKDWDKQSDSEEGSDE